MSALRRLTVTNFRSLRRVSVELHAVNVLVGPNESGKSNFLDVIQFLGDSVREDLGPAIDRRGGFDRLRFRGVEGGSIEIKVEATVTQYSSDTAPDEYTLRFFVRDMKGGRQALVRNEAFTFKRTQGRGRRVTMNEKSFVAAAPSALSAVRIVKTRMCFEAADETGLSSVSLRAERVRASALCTAAAMTTKPTKIPKSEI